MNSQNFWEQTQYASLTAQNLFNLFENKIPAIQIPNFATQAECRAFSTAAHNANFAYHERVPPPPIGRIGVPQFGYIKKTKDEYFVAVKQEYQTQREIINKSFHPLNRLLEMLRSTVSTEVNISQDGQFGNFFAGLVRLIHKSVPLHMDFIQTDAPEWGVANVDAQLAWNLFLSVPERGGECIVYNRLWQPEDEMHKVTGGELELYYTPELVQKCQTKEIKPILGNVVLFNSRNFHEVKDSYGERMTFTSFIGRKPNGNIVIWS